MTGLMEFEHADLGYGRRAVLTDVNLVFREGEAVGLVGPNGSGKTTFLRAALGLLRPIRGKVLHPLPKRFAYVPQADELNLLWPLTLREAVELPARAGNWWGRRTAAAKARAEAALEAVGVSAIADRLLREVSGGQRQRTAIAQAIAQAPDVILLDEPTKGLDVVAERDVLDLIGGLTRRGLTVFLVSHTLHIPLNLAQRILLFHNGNVIETTPEEIVRTNKLEDVYGVPFVHIEEKGQRLVMPAREKSR